MAHYAELGVDNVVKRVLFIDTIKCMTNGGIEKEEIGARLQVVDRPAM